MPKLFRRYTLNNQNRQKKLHDFWRRRGLFITGLAMTFFVSWAAMGHADALYIFTGVDDAAIVLDDSTDEVPDLSSQLVYVSTSSQGYDVTLAAGQTVTIHHQGSIISAQTRKETISSLLGRLHIEPAPLEMVAVDLSGSGVELKFSTGGEQGTYYGFGNVLAQAITSAGTGTKVTAVTSNGSQDNIEQMEMNTRQLGFVQSDVMSYAYEGTNLFEGMPITGFSTVAALYMEQVQIVTCDPDIKSVADLEGKTVSIGASGSGVYYNALDILAAYDLTEDDINAQYQDFGASADALQDGKIDAAFVVAGAPTVAITTLATAKDTYLVGLDDEHIAKLQESSPYYEEYIIPEGTYEGVPETKTVAVVATVIARDDVSEDDVYNICYTIFENMDNLAHDKAGELDVEFASGVTAVPYHAGAAKYFAEKGFDVPTK